MSTDQSITSVEYRDIPGFPGYRVGSDGSVWSCRTRGPNQAARQPGPWRPMVPGRIRGGYLMAGLRRDGKKHGRFVHRLVLEAFVGPRPDDHEARHFPNPDRTDNRLANLQWGTRSENFADKVFHGTDGAGVRNPRAKITPEQIDELFRLRGQGWSQSQLGRRFGLGQSQVSRIIRGESWSCLAGR